MFSRMKSFTQLAGVLALVGSGAISGLAQAVISPGSAVGAPSNAANFFPFSASSIAGVPSMRYQQVYAAGDFASTGGPITIRQLAFRLSGQGGNSFNTTLPDIQIDLSTTRKAPDGLSATFSDNTGSDNTVVISRGPLAFSSAGSDLGGYYAFDILIPLTQPFTYDPSKGNLLLDVRSFAPVYSSLLDAQSSIGDSVSRVYAPSVAAVSGTADSLGLATQFSSVILRALSGTARLEGSANPAQPVVLRLTNLDRPTAPPIVATQILTPILNAAGKPTSQGAFSLNGIPSAHYHFKIQGLQFLGASQNLDLTVNNTDGLAFTLLAGDANGDNVVDSTDFGILIGAFGGDISVENSGYDPGADLNDDGVVDSTDFGLLINNFGLSGAN